MLLRAHVRSALRAQPPDYRTQPHVQPVTLVTTVRLVAVPSAVRVRLVPMRPVAAVCVAPAQRVHSREAPRGIVQHVVLDDTRLPVPRYVRLVRLAPTRFPALHPVHRARLDTGQQQE